MISIKLFVHNAFRVNSFVLYDETNEGIIIDPACYSKDEQTELKDFITENNIQIKAVYNTHPHVDHVLGNYFCKHSMGLPIYAHQAGEVILSKAIEHGSHFGFKVEEPPVLEGYIKEGDIISFGNSKFAIIYIPGHCDGSVAFYNSDEDFAIVGDVLFREGIGRSDLETGNQRILLNSIKTKLYTLPDTTIIFPGHGEKTSIEYEKKNNPYINAIS